QKENSLANLKSQLASVNNGGRTGGSGGSGGSSGCYIATMAYGDYDHPQVMILRQFRDEVLDKSAFGKWFIKTYYHYSPKLVERLKNRKTVNIIIRKALNQFIKLIK
ncbi:CFI-box-CTERM domain-containing protein, partial [Flavobacterium filum]|uniref:CFI-box-CTERM domain-containing protein n=1 Tax=Flavobacterium filum TaxID=370974 RepID=UPI0023F18E04